MNPGTPSRLNDFAWTFVDIYTCVCVCDKLREDAGEEIKSAEEDVKIYEARLEKARAAVQIKKDIYAAYRERF